MDIITLPMAEGAMLMPCTIIAMLVNSNGLRHRTDIVLLNKVVIPRIQATPVLRPSRTSSIMQLIIRIVQITILIRRQAIISNLIRPILMPSQNTIALSGGRDWTLKVQMIQKAVAPRRVPYLDLKPSNAIHPIKMKITRPNLKLKG